MSYLVGNKCHNIFLFISVCNIGYIDVSCSELNDVSVMTVGDQSISELKVHKVTLRCLCFGDVAESGVIAQNSGGSWFLEFVLKLNRCFVSLRAEYLTLSIATCTSSWMVWISYARRAWTIYELG